MPEVETAKTKLLIASLPQQFEDERKKKLYK